MADFPTLSMPPSRIRELAFDDDGISFDAEGGWQQTRRRFTRERPGFEVSQILSIADMELFRAFKDDMGIFASFNWTYPTIIGDTYSQTVFNMRFIARPEIDYDTKFDRWAVTYRVRVV